MADSSRTIFPRRIVKRSSPRVGRTKIGDSQTQAASTTSPTLSIRTTMIVRSGPREREVASLIADGRSNKEIAAELVITVATVKDHVHRVLRKSGLRTRAAVASEWQRAHVATLAP